jgi:1-deoxyxylulose-5-phosphate synthase
MATADSNPFFQQMNRPVSKIALGTAFFSNDTQIEHWDLLDHFIEHGGTLIDSGRIYRNSEQVIGKWLQRSGKRNRVLLLTKGGHGDAVLPSEHLSTVLTEELKTSLEMLQTDFIDCYMLHRDNETVPVEHIMDILNTLLETKAIGVLGASNWSYARIEAANAYAAKQNLKGFVVVSNHLSLAKQREPFYTNLKEVSPSDEQWHYQTQIPLIPWSSQARGYFTGRFTPTYLKEHNIPQEGFEKRMVEVYHTPENQQRLERANQVAAHHGSTAMEVALAFVLHKSFPIIPVVGPKNSAELESCFKATTLTLSPEELKWLDLQQDEPPFPS